MNFITNLKTTTSMIALSVSLMGYNAYGMDAAIKQTQMERKNYLCDVGNEQNYNLGEILCLFNNNNIDESPLSYLSKKDVKNLLITSQCVNKVSNELLENNTYLDGYMDNIRSNKLRLLSLDGGGIRGIIEIAQLAVLEKITGKQCYELFDVFAGTSTGGIIAAALSFGLTAENILRLYMKCGPEIFKKGMNNHIDTYGIWTTQYDSRFIEKILTELTKMKDGSLCKFDNTREGHLKKRVFLTSYDMNNKKGLLFDSENLGVQENDLATLLRATSAAPTYFDPANNIRCNGLKLSNCVDGGLYVNNPTLVVVNSLIKENMQKIESGEEKGEHKDLDVYSFGTGNTSANPCSIDFNNRSALTWTSSLLEALFNSSAMETDESMDLEKKKARYDNPQRLSVYEYYRNQPKLIDPKTHEMSNTDLETTDLLLSVGSSQVFDGKIVELLDLLGFVGQKYRTSNIIENDKAVMSDLNAINIKSGNDWLYFYGVINDYVLQEDENIRSSYLAKLTYGDKKLYEGNNLSLTDFTIEELNEINDWIEKFIESNLNHDNGKSISSKVKGGMKWMASCVMSVNDSKHVELGKKLETIWGEVKKEIQSKNDDFKID